MILWLSGPTGAGKTTLALVLRSFGFIVIPEEIDQNKFDAFVASSRTRDCELLQAQIMRDRYENWRKVRRASDIVFDRSVDEDINVFCRLHLATGHLREQQFQRLRTLAGRFRRSLPAPDLIIAMTAPIKVLSARLAANKYPVLIRRNLEVQYELYQDWFLRRSEPLIRIDNADCSPGQFRDLLARSGLDT